MKVTRLAGAAVLAALGVRVVRSRHRRFLHPDGRSFTGELVLVGGRSPVRRTVTVRFSKGAGTRPGRADVLGVAVRVHGPDAADLLLSTAGTGRLTRHLPVPRRSFDTRYGSILSYRDAGGHKVYLAAEPDPDGPPLGDSLESVTEAASRGARLLLHTVEDSQPALIGRILLGEPLPAHVDAALAFDPIRNAPAQLHPTGLIHASRAYAYRLSQRWRRAEPAPPAPHRVRRTAAHR
jgi:hypothetical protein